MSKPLDKHTSFQLKDKLAELRKANTAANPIPQHQRKLPEVKIHKNSSAKVGISEQLRKTPCGLPS